MCLAKISACCRSAVSCASLIGENGVLGCGCCIAAVRSRAASIAASVDDVVGILNKCGKNSTVLAILSDLVLVIYTLWHR